MKQLLFTLMFASSLFASCVSKQAARQVENQRDSLAVVVGEKDSLINAVFSDINAISENLALIKSREHLIAVSTAPEGGRRPLEDVRNDIAAIDRLLRKTERKSPPCNRPRPSCAKPTCTSRHWRRPSHN